MKPRLPIFVVVIADAVMPSEDEIVSQLHLNEFEQRELCQTFGISIIPKTCGANMLTEKVGS